MYGATEPSVATAAMPDDWRAAPGTVGRPPVGCTVALFDRDGRRITKPYMTGRVFVGNDLTFNGYTDGQHREIIDGMLSCGDLGHFDSEGRLFLDGRADDMIVSGGENVHPVEIENLLLKHAGVADAAVVGVPDREFGQRLRACVVPKPGADLDGDELRAFVRSNLARYKVPRDVVFMDELPRSPTGKLRRRQLAQDAAHQPWARLTRPSGGLRPAGRPPRSAGRCAKPGAGSNPVRGVVAGSASSATSHDRLLPGKDHYRAGLRRIR